MVNEMVLPKTLEWYKSDGFTIGEKRKDLLFTNISLSKDKLADTVFSKPQDGVVKE